MHNLELIEVGKEYKGKIAVHNMNASIGHGIYGLLGENGAGKTTLMRMICGILKPTNGKILCNGMDIRKMGGNYRSLLGYLPQDFGYYEDFTAWRFLNYMAALKAMPEAETKHIIMELLEMVDLINVKDKKLKTYSGGMLRRIGIAQALLNDPEILILDEPTAGLDPKERVRFRNIISSLSKNRIILLSTHIVSDIEYIADQIMIMKNGSLIQMGSEQKIVEEAQGYVWKCIVTEKQSEDLNNRFIVSNLRHRENQIELRIVSKEKPLPEAIPVEAVLEDVYLYHLGD